MAELAASAADAPLKLIYFPLWAKGPAPALALAHSGLAWTGENPGDWKALKPTTPWGELPVLEIPGAGALGHELAILNYLGTRAAALRGATEAEFLVSQQLVCEAEDVYQKLVKVQPTLYARAKPPEGFLAFWSAADATVHNRDFGLQIYLEHLDYPTVDVLDVVPSVLHRLNIRDVKLGCRCFVVDPMDLVAIKTITGLNLAKHQVAHLKVCFRRNGCEHDNIAKFN